MNLLPQLKILENANLVRLTATLPEIEYLFRHALIQETAYASFVRADRRLVHRLVGDCLEQLYADRKESPELAPQLARHFEEAGDAPRAQHYYTLAADAALARYANAEAVAFFSRVLASADSQTVDSSVWRHLYTARGRALELNSDFAQALANYQDMEQRARASGDRHLALAASILQCQLHATATPLFDPPIAERLSEAALVEARTIDDRAAEAKILWTQVNLYRFTLRNSLARASGERSLAIARELGLREQTALTLNDLIHVYSGLGLWAAAKPAGLEASELWRELGNLPMLADSLTTLALYSAFFGEIDSALRLADESYQLSTTIGNGWGQSYSLSSIGWAYWYRGEPDRAFQVIEAGIELGVLAGYNVPQIFARGQLAVMMAELGDVKRGLALAHEALAWAERILPQGMATVLAIRAMLELRELGIETAAATLAQIDTGGREAMVWEIDGILSARSAVALAQDDAGRALAVTQEHLSRVQSLGLELYVPEARIGLSRALMRFGRAAEARQQLLQARAAAEALGARMVLWRVLYALGQVEAGEGHLAEAEALWNEAREIVNGIAAHTPDSELHRSFLKRPEVQELFAGPPLQAVDQTGIEGNGTL